MSNLKIQGEKPHDPLPTLMAMMFIDSITRCCQLGCDARSQDFADWSNLKVERLPEERNQGQMTNDFVQSFLKK